jgi:hypothetical protein
MQSPLTDTHTHTHTCCGWDWVQVVFVSGGVWTIGYKAWGAFFGRILATQGLVAVMADYRNFPQGRVQHMLADVDAALAWVHAHIAEYGGDPDCIHLMGPLAPPARSPFLYTRTREVSSALVWQSEREGETDMRSPMHECMGVVVRLSPKRMCPCSSWSTARPA